jgi:hypothetical protein
MKRFATLFVAVGLATAGSTVLAEEAKDQVSKQDAKPQPVQMTEAQLDNVAAGLITVVAVDVVDINRNNVAVPVTVQLPVNAAVAVLGEAAAAQLPRFEGSPGRVRQTQ